MDMGVGVIVPMGMPVAMGMAVSMGMMMGAGRGGNHGGTLYYNITPVHDPCRHSGMVRRTRPGIARFRFDASHRPGMTTKDFAPAHGLPITIAMAAATKGNGTETAQRNQTNRAGMNGISHKITRWKANSAQATT